MLFPDLTKQIAEDLQAEVAKHLPDGWPEGYIIEIWSEVVHHPWMIWKNNHADFRNERGGLMFRATLELTQKYPQIAAAELLTAIATAAR